VDDAKTFDGIVISYKADILGNSVLPEEIRLVQAHLNDLLLKVLMQTEEE
jgi:hypothetical protein